MAAERSAYSVPSVPPAPGRFSTTTGWPSLSLSTLEATRAMKSEPPPGAKGQTIFSDLLGKASWARPWCGSARPASGAGRAAQKRRRLMLMGWCLLQSYGWQCTRLVASGMPSDSRGNPCKHHSLLPEAEGLQRHLLPHDPFH